MRFQLDVAKARDLANTLRLSAKDLENVAADLSAVAKDIDSNNDEFMSTHEVGGNLNAAAEAIKQRKEDVEAIATALDDMADKTVEHEGKVLSALKQKTK